MSARTVSPFNELYRRINAKDKQILATEIREQGDLPVVDQGKAHIAGYTNDLSKRYTPPPGGVIIFGDHTRIVKFADFDFAIGADGTQLIAARSENDTRFLAFLLAAQEIPNTGYNRHFKFLKEMTFSAPPLHEQQAIAAALSDADGVVAGLERVIAKKHLIKQGAMQDLLTARRRLPGFSGDWEPVNLAKESHLKARIGWQGLTTSEYRDSGEYHLITGTEIIDGRVDWRRCVFVDKWRFDQDRNIQLRNADVLLTKDGTIGKVAQVRDLPGPAALNSGVFVIRPKSDAYDATFLFHVLRSSVFDTFLAKLTAGSTIVHLYQKDLVAFEFLAPGIEEQRAIAAALDDMDAEILTLQDRLTKARAVKEGMMQNLLTGRVRLV
jgi:type I restriction enzyme S subunit